MSEGAARLKERYFTTGRCTNCGRLRERPEIRMCNGCARSTSLSRLAFKERCRDKVFAHYGQRCVCCGETIRAFLVVDHIGGGGHAHREAEAYAAGNIYGWLVKNDFPDLFQILCSNCNHATKDGKPCPHQDPSNAQG